LAFWLLWLQQVLAVAKAYMANAGAAVAAAIAPVLGINRG